MNENESIKTAVEHEITGLEVAVIGMAGRFPGAGNIHEFWNNLKNGVETISFFSAQELKEAGIGPGLLDKPHYVKARGVLEEIACFDSFFFNYTQSEAELMDPQVRVFHEIAWTALERAGYDPDRFDGLIGFYAGAGHNHYWEGLAKFSGKSEEMGHWRADQLLDKDYMSMEISYKLNLEGPAFSVYTACSTSLVAVHLACQALLNGECDMALAGGVTLHMPDKTGHIYQEGMILSPDGHCRAFDAKAGGTLPGNGAGIVVLKLLEEAAAHRDYIYAVIKGSAINNDGLRKGAFTAPAVEGQADAIGTALQAAHVEPDSISYVEAHGTATSLGDPIEIEALKLAFKTNKKNFCAIGSVKSNIGHLDTAAGIAGLIKTILALKHRLIPPSLHFERPNPEIDFENSPFYVNTQLKEWENQKYPLRAGISSFGIGGTNAHVVLEEWHIAQGAQRSAQSTWCQGKGGVSPPSQSRDYQLIMLSAKTQSALDKMTENLAEYLKQNLLNRGNHENPTNPGPTLADAAYTLQVGRKEFPHRKTLVCSTRDEVIQALESDGPPKAHSFVLKGKAKDRSVVFMFPGLGSQYVNMGWQLYQEEPVFREELERCFEILVSLVDFNIKEILYPFYRYNGSNRSYKIDQFQVAQLAIFIFEYALAQLLIQWGIRPQAMIGYSFGEYAAACTAGVFSLEEALKLVVIRGRLIEETPKGAMLSVPLGEEKLKPFLGNELSIAIDNGSSCIAAGPAGAIDTLAGEMKKNKYLCMPLQASHAVHSRMMEPILEKFAENVGQLNLKKPKIPYISNVTGKWITVEEATNPGYWSTHLRNTVRFASGINELVKNPEAIFLEIGPGHDLSTLVNRYINNNSHQKMINLVRNPQKQVSDTWYLYNKIGQLWLYGKTPDWTGFHRQEKRCRIPLPTYSFERQQYPIEGKSFPKGTAIFPGKAGQAADLDDWFHIPTWTRLMLLSRESHHPGSSPWLVFLDENCSPGLMLAERLKQEGYKVIVVKKGNKFSKKNPGAFVINHSQENDYHRLFDELASLEVTLSGIIHLWGLDKGNPDPRTRDRFENTLEDGFYSLLYTIAAIAGKNLGNQLQVDVITNHMQDVNGEEQLCPGKAAVIGPIKVIPQEFPGIKCRSIDVIPPAPGSPQEQELVDRLVKEILTVPGDTVVAYRGHYRWVQTFKPVRLEKPKEKPRKLKEKGVYLIIGGLGKIGLMLAEYLAKGVKAKLILTGRTAMPARHQWDEWQSAHEEQDPVSQKIRKIKKLEDLAAEVLVISGDAADKHHMKRIINRAEERFGPLNGIIHSAGIMRGPSVRMIRELTKEQCQQQFRPKVDGCFILEELIKDKELDFCMIISSLSAVLGGVRFAAYAAANIFMDAFVNQHNRHHPTKWTSVDWEGMDRRETHMCFQRIFALDNVHQVVVSKGGNLQTRIDRWIKLETLKKKDQVAAGGENLSSHLSRPDLLNPYIPPRDSVEKTLVETWEGFFGFKPLGIQDDFFELGGDSLKAITMISVIHRKLSVYISLSDFFNRPTIEKLAQLITHEEKTTYTSINPVEKREYYALTSAQKRLYFLQQIDKESTSYNETHSILLASTPDPRNLGKVFRRLIQRHESFRTSIPMIKENPVQVIHDKVEFEIEQFDLAARTREETRRKNKTHHSSFIIHHSFVRPFDLSRAPFLRVGLIKTENRRHILVVDLHHIVTDGVSYGILVKEFRALYTGEELSAPRLQYKDYAEWLKREPQQALLKKQEAYWLERFQGEIPVLKLPVDFPRPAKQSFEGRRVKFGIKKEEHQRLKNLAIEEESTFNMVLSAIYIVFLFKITGQEEIVVGTGVLGRRHPDLDTIIGMFFKPLALRSYPKPAKTFGEFLKEVRVSLLEAFENQDYPYEELVEKVVRQRNPGRSPLFDTGFVLQNFGMQTAMYHESLNTPGPSKVQPSNTNTELNMKSHTYNERTARFDLTLLAEEFDEQLLFTFEYCTRLFKKETIERYIKYFKEIIAHVVEDKEIKLGDISITYDLLPVESKRLKDYQGDFVF